MFTVTIANYHYHWRMMVIWLKASGDRGLKITPFETCFTASSAKTFFRRDDPSNVLRLKRNAKIPSIQFCNENGNFGKSNMALFLWKQLRTKWLKNFALEF